MKGVKKSPKDENDVWLFLYKRDEVSFSDWLNGFVDSGLMSKSTWLKYKLALEKEGKVKKRISEKTNTSVYYTPPEKTRGTASLS